ncbi:MAG: hypothetical protein IKK41_03345 [Oscillospiraceae bacterium]|nr:hypothetical protein [Oscillospiraceae bacterium]
MKIPDHPDIARTLLTGCPREYKSVQCADCEKELYGDEKIYISDGDTVCGDCLKKRILEDYDIDVLADAFDIRKTTADDYLEESEENPYDGE